MTRYDPHKPADAIAALGRLEVCCTCRKWRPEALAYPDSPSPGSQRVCARGRTVSSGMWCREWEAPTEEEAIEAAHAAGRLF